MSTSIDEALQRLRAADPARDVEPAQWVGSPAQVRAAERVDVPDVAPLAHRRRPRWPLASAAAVAAVALGIAVAVIGTRHSPDSVPAGPGSFGSQAGGLLSISPSSAPSAARAGDNYRQARQLVVLLASTFPVLPDATARSTAPTRVLTDPGSEPASGNLVSATAWWTAPGSIDAALAYYRAHVPAGLTEDGTSSGGGSQGDTFEGISFGSADRPFATEIEVLARLVTTSSGVAVRVDAQAVWRPLRPSAETITDPSAVAVTVERSAAATVIRTLDQAAAQHLADVVNRLQLAFNGLHNCPMDTGRDRDTLRFTTGSGPVEVIADRSGCRDVSLSANGVDQPGLADGDGTLDRALLAALGLPARYGR